MIATYISEHLQWCNTSVNDIFIIFTSCFRNTLNKHALGKKSTKRKMKTKCKPWITKGILKSINTKNKLYYQCFKQKKSCLTATYKNYVNILTTTKGIAKDNYYMEAHVTICRSANPNYLSKLSIVSGLVNDLFTISIIIYKHSKYMTETKEKHSNKEMHT